jgi:hypothetical protein
MVPTRHHTPRRYIPLKESKRDAVMDKIAREYDYGHLEQLESKPRPLRVWNGIFARRRQTRQKGPEDDISGQRPEFGELSVAGFQGSMRPQNTWLSQHSHENANWSSELVSRVV